MFEIGQVVWAKVKGYPWWPAIIGLKQDFSHQKYYSQYNTRLSNQFPMTEYLVDFIGEFSHTWLTEDKIRKFMIETMNSYNRRLKSKKFSSALYFAVSILNKETTFEYAKSNGWKVDDYTIRNRFLNTSNTLKNLSFSNYIKKSRSLIKRLNSKKKNSFSIIRKSKRIRKTPDFYDGTEKSLKTIRYKNRIHRYHKMTNKILIQVDNIIANREQLPQIKETLNILDQILLRYINSKPKTLYMIADKCGKCLKKLEFILSSKEEEEIVQLKERIALFNEKMLEILKDHFFGSPKEISKEPPLKDISNKKMLRSSNRLQSEEIQELSKCNPTKNPNMNLNEKENSVNPNIQNKLCAKLTETLMENYELSQDLALKTSIYLEKEIRQSNVVMSNEYLEKMFLMMKCFKV